MNGNLVQSTTKWPQIVAGLAANGGAFAVGTALGWPAPVGPRLVNEGDDRYFEITQSQFDWTVSIITVGCAISCLPIGILMKKFGRKWSMISLVVPFLVGWTLIAWAQNFAMLFIGRFIVGLAGGAFCVSAPQYSSEIAEKEIRGIIGTFCVSMINSGILFVYIVGAYASVFWTTVTCLIIPLVFGLVFFFMPESPVYFIAKNREEDALKSFKWLRGETYNPANEIAELKFENEENRNRTTSIKEVLSKRATKHALLIGFGLMFFQQTSGINVVLFYATFIFKVRLIRLKLRWGN
jgi:MFS family permease